MSKQEAAPKPKFAVVENSLKCQTENGELSLPLTVKFGTIRKLLGSTGLTQFEEMEFFMTEIFSEADNRALDDLDAAEAGEILTEYSDALSKRFKVSMGKSVGSSDSSESTEEQ
ncbi:hypothetical protein [Paenarthrobacter nicotinovorans]|uniref:hypothetical protein n=1 Tax=Paenarthrobacter nicotinovorans TaxID=29320 RepID=UPI002486C84E|nr:hypothetical protein [Paenarthrobacter nicotinovorans]MDI2019698.1 hypothetical protein [Paenarthrobacter nicotinovorans]